MRALRLRFRAVAPATIPYSAVRFFARTQFFFVPVPLLDHLFAISKHGRRQRNKTPLKRLVGSRFISQSDHFVGVTYTVLQAHFFPFSGLFW